jgi:hypothetical protein
MAKRTTDKRSMVDKIIDQTAERHAEEARIKKLRSENIRLGPRRRLGNAFYVTLKKEIDQHKGVRVRVSLDRIAQYAEELAKKATKDLALEPNTGKGKED